METLSKEIRVMIRQEIWLAVEAGRSEHERQTKNAYQSTERRLASLPYLRIHVSDLMDEIRELQEIGPRSRSKDISRYLKNGSRLDPDEVQAALIASKEYELARDKREISKLERVLELIEGDEHYLTIYGRYISGMSDEQIAEKTHYDKTTIWRNRKRLIERLAILLYGVSAV